MNTTTFQEYDWTARYGPNWRKIANHTEKLQTINGRVICAWCGNDFDHKETQVHHARYGLYNPETGQWQLLQDNAQPHNDVFAVCGKADQAGTCHHALHQYPLWIECSENRVAGDRNNDDVIFQLMQNSRRFTNKPEAQPMSGQAPNGWQSYTGPGDQQNGRPAPAATRYNNNGVTRNGWGRNRRQETEEYDIFNPRGSKRVRSGNFWGVIRYPVYGGAGLVGAWILLRSLGIYRDTFRIWGLDATGGVCDSLNVVPFIGGAFAGGCSFISSTTVGLVALVTLIALTTLMSIPIFIAFVPSAIAGMVDQLRHNKRTHTPLQMEAGDTAEVEGLIRRHNELPAQALRTLIGLSLAAFAIEMFIVWTARGGRATIGTCLVDSLGFEALLTIVFVFRMAFIPKPKRTVREI